MIRKQKGLVFTDKYFRNLLNIFKVVLIFVGRVSKLINIIYSCMKVSAVLVPRSTSQKKLLIRTFMS